MNAAHPFQPLEDAELALLQMDQAFRRKILGPDPMTDQKVRGLRFARQRQDALVKRLSLQLPTTQQDKEDTHD